MWAKYKSTFYSILSIVLAIGISVGIYLLRDKTEQLATWGYPGIFLFSILSNATIILPAPGVALVFTLGGVLNPLAVGIIAGVGSAIGELSGYLAGVSGRGIITHTDVYQFIHPIVEKYGGLAIFVLAAIPNPFFDLAGIASGALKVPAKEFLFWCTLGKIVKMLVFAYSGASSISWLTSMR